jgi:hypothetical protein
MNRIEEIDAEIQRLYEEKEAIERASRTGDAQEFIAFFVKNGIIDISYYGCSIEFFISWISDEKEEEGDTMIKRLNDCYNHGVVDLDKNISIDVDDSRSRIIYNPIDFTQETTQKMSREKMVDWLVSIGFDIQNRIIFDRANMYLSGQESELNEKKTNIQSLIHRIASCKF